MTERDREQVIYAIMFLTCNPLGMLAIILGICWLVSLTR